MPKTRIPPTVGVPGMPPSRPQGRSPSYRRVLETLAHRGNEVQEIHLGLQRMQAMMSSAGNPHLRIPVMHIAGTNGKGSVAAMAESILRYSGFTTGLYTSPHLIRLEERIRVNGRNITSRKLADVASRVIRIERKLIKQGLLDRSLSYFELITACAFLHFAECMVDVAVVEVGLGGALDATNVVAPAVCIVTGVAYDHQDLLGDSLEKIATEKAGIIKQGVPVVSGCKTGPARRIVRAKAREKRAPLVEIDRDCAFRPIHQRNGLSTIDLVTPMRRYERLRIPLAGDHQIRNAALAVAGVEALIRSSVRINAARRGMAATRWPGRIDAYAGPRHTLLDGAHNPDGARQLACYLKKYQHRKIHLVFGAMRDKDIRNMSKALFPLSDKIHLTPIANPRSSNPREIAAMHPRFLKRIQMHDGSAEALRSAWSECASRGLVVVTGSLYLVGEVLPLLRRSRRSRRRHG